MNESGATWAIVLAAGEGTRLRTLTTTDAGVAVPKQFCSLRGGPSLLQETLQRARSIASPARTCTIVARQHRVWWEPPLAGEQPANVIVQPQNRGTANGILFAVLHVMKRDPQAVVVLLPSDHHVADEARMQRALHAAAAQATDDGNSIVVLGLAPDELDPDLGYIIPGEKVGGVCRVDAFVEKPSLERARELIAAGGLWNAFIMAARAQTLVELFASRFPWEAQLLESAVRQDADTPRNPRAATQVYESLRTIDFSREVLQVFPQRLRVLTVPSCGWSDLGTPERVTRILAKTPRCEAPPRREVRLCHPITLSEQHRSRYAMELRAEG